MNFNQHIFNPVTGTVSFPDGVEYSIREAMHIAHNARKEDLEAIHMVKKIFDGQVLTGKERFNETPTVTRFEKIRRKSQEMKRRNVNYISNIRKKGTLNAESEPRTEQTCLFSPE